MREVLRKPIMQNVRLTCLQTDKFKTGVFSVTMLTELTKDNVSKNALLPYVLRRGTARHNNIESIAATLDDLYGARIEPVVRKKGEVQCVGFYADFPDDYFLPGKAPVLEKVIDLTAEMLMAPATKSGLLLNEYVSGEKQQLLDEIRSVLNNKGAYAVARLTELMCSKENYGLDRLGKESFIKKITASALTKHYRKLIASAPLELFYCGSADPQRVESAVLTSFASLPRSGAADIPQTKIVTEPAKTEMRIFEDKMDVTQGKLAIGFRMGESMMRPDYPAILVFNAIFGGSATSKLFANVRERLSLCYYANSSVDKHKGVMIVSSGIEFDKYKAAEDEIFAQLEAVKNGDISDGELASAKKTVINALKTSMDSLSALESLYLDNCIADIQFSPEIMAGLVDAVTKEDVVKIASGIKADSVYFLTGNGGIKNEN